MRIAYRAGEWAPPLAKELPACRLRIINKGKQGSILLEDATVGSLFAESPLREPVEKYVDFICVLGFFSFDELSLLNS
jgi:hypothetical protein